MNPLLSSVLSAALLAVLTVSSVVLFVPQLVRLVRFRDPAGLSGSSLLFGTVNYTAWSVYLTDAGSWGLLAANVVASLVWYAVAFLALTRLRPERSWWLPAIWAVAITTVVVVERPALGAVLGLGSMLTYTPQAIGAWRAPSLAGISPTTWGLTALEGGVWLVQSLRDGLLGGILSGVIAVAAAAAVLLALRVRGTTPDLEPDRPTTPDDEHDGSTSRDNGLDRPATHVDDLELLWNLDTLPDAA